MPSSLEILNPRPWASRKRAWTSETAKMIAEVSEKLIKVASDRDWENPLLKHLTKDFHAEFDHAGGLPINSWADYIKHHDRLAQANPDYRFEALDAVADVYEKSGTGAAYLLLRVTGHPVNVVRESVIVMYWRQEDQEWRCHGQKVIRGMMWNA